MNPKSRPRYATLSLGILLSLCACSSGDFGQTSEALMSTYRIGSATTVAGTTPTAITFLYQSLPYIPSPSFKPEAGTSFVQSFSIGNGGYHLSNGQGNLNKLTFRIYQVVLADGTEYFAATADVWKADATGHTTLTSNVLTVTAWFKWRFELYWQDGVLSFYVYDQLWHYEMSATYALTFTSGPPVTTAYSPELDFTINSTPSIGCKNDILAYDDISNGMDTGHYTVDINYGVDVNSQVIARVAAPTSLSMCSLTTENHQWEDVVRWTVQGF